MAASPKYVDLSDSIMSGLENIRKWYGKTDDTDAYFVCLGSQIFTLHGISADILLQSLIQMSLIYIIYGLISTSTQIPCLLQPMEL